MLGLCARVVPPAEVSARAPPFSAAAVAVWPAAHAAPLAGTGFNSCCVKASMSPTVSRLAGWNSTRSGSERHLQAAKGCEMSALLVNQSKSTLLMELEHNWCLRAIKLCVQHGNQRLNCLHGSGSKHAMDPQGAALQMNQHGAAVPDHLLERVNLRGAAVLEHPINGVTEQHLQRPRLHQHLPARGGVVEEVAAQHGLEAARLLRLVPKQP
eukprot:58919-Pelagomonas_calceolata.AAC.1